MMKTVKIARKKCENKLKRPSGKVEIGLDESKSCLYADGIDQTTNE